MRTGEPAFAHTWGQHPFAFFADHPQEGAIFNEFMVAQTTLQSAAVLDAYCFPSGTTIVDVGGGQGALLAAMLQRDPSLRGVLFDRPAVVAQAEAVFERAGVGDRCTIVGGDFFTSVPSGGDVYVLKNVLHNWGDVPATAILAACRRGMHAGARLVVVEVLIPPGDEPGFGKFLDLAQLVLTGGRERTAAEYRSLFAAAGFELARVVPTRAALSVLEGTPTQP